MAEYDSETNDGVARMKGLIARLKSVSALTDADSINPTADRGAQAVWGKNVSIFMQFGPSTGSAGTCTVYVVVTVGGRQVGPELSFDMATLSGKYGEVLAMINDVIPKIKEERAAFAADLASVQKEADLHLASLATTAPEPVENPFITALRQLSPEDKATALSILGGA